MLRAVRWLNLRRISRQPLRSALALAAIAAGVSLVVAVIVTSASLTSAVRRLNTQLAGPAPLRVEGAISRGGIEPVVAARIAAVPGVSVAVPAVLAVTYAADRTGRSTAVVAIGVNCRLFAPVDCAGRIMASAALQRQLGGGAVIRTNEGRIPLDGPGVAALDGFNHGRIVVLDVPTAQRVFDRGTRFDVVYVVPRAGADLAKVRAAVVAAAGPQNTVLRASEPSSTASNTGPIVPLLALVSLFALGVGALLVYNMTTLALAERRRDLAIVGALGGTDRLTIVGVALEAAAVGALGGVVGWGAGLVIAHFVVASLNNLAGLNAGVSIGMSVPRIAVVEGVVLGTVTASLATIVPARRATRLNLSRQLQERDEPDAVRRAAGWRAGVALAVGSAGVVATHLAVRGGGLGSWQQPVAMIGTGCAVAGWLAGVGLVTPVVIAAVRRVARLRGEAGLALASLVRDTGRTAVVATSVAIAVGFGVLLTSALPSIRSMSVRIAKTDSAGRVAFNTLPLINFARFDSRASPALLAQVKALPGVAGVDRTVFMMTGQAVGGQPVAVVAREHEAYAYPVLAGRDPENVVKQGRVLVGSALARKWHLHPGSTVTLDAPRGRVAFVVGAVWEDIDQLGFNVTVRWDIAQRIWGAQPVDIAYARPMPGVTPDQLKATIRAAHLDPDMRVATPAELGDTAAVAYNSFLGPFRVLQRGLLLVTLIAVMATLLLVGVQRRRELGVLAAVGMGPAKLGRQALLEAGITGTVAAILTLAACVPLSMAIQDVMLFIVGIRTGPTMHAATLGLSVVTALVVVCIAAAVPAWQTARLPIVEALHYE